MAPAPLTRLAVAAFVAASSAAVAQEAPPADAPPASPAAASGDNGPICTDRPTKANFACTVPAGHIQYEADLVNVTWSTQAGVTTDTVFVTNPTFKYGLTAKTDIEANLSPLVIVRTRSDGQATTLSGIGDLYLRFKYQAVDLPGDALQVTLLPYVKAPTARLGIGDGALEGGLLAPVNVKLSSVVTFTTVPEADELKDQVGWGHHLATAQLINLSLTLPKNFTLYGELWGDWNFDPRGLIRQESADAAFTYGMTARLQLDAGVNVGLNRATPAAQVYVGLSQRF